MSRRRWVYQPDAGGVVVAIEVPLDYQRYAERVPVTTDRHHEGNRAPDGTDISSRSKRREWMSATGSADASDFSPEFYRRKQQESAAPSPGMRDAIRAAYNRRK